MRLGDPMSRALLALRNIEFRLFSNKIIMEQLEMQYHEQNTIPYHLQFDMKSSRNSANCHRSKSATKGKVKRAHVMCAKSDNANGSYRASL